LIAAVKVGSGKTGLIKLAISRCCRCCQGYMSRIGRCRTINRK